MGDVQQAYYRKYRLISLALGGIIRQGYINRFICVSYMFHQGFLNFFIKASARLNEATYYQISLFMIGITFMSPFDHHHLHEASGILLTDFVPRPFF